MSEEHDQDPIGLEEEPQVFTVKKDLSGWRFDRRTFLAAAGATVAAATVGTAAGCGAPVQQVMLVTETASPVPIEPSSTLAPTPSEGTPPSDTPTAVNLPSPTASSPPPTTPPLGPTATTAPTLTPTAEAPQAEFVKDVTVPDGTTMKPNQPFTKTWRYRNSGNVPWGEGVKLVFVSGTQQGFQSNQMGGPDFVAVPNVAPGKTQDISVNLVAPAKAGKYRSYWRLQLANGTWLDKAHYVEIVVVVATATTPPRPTDTPPPTCICVGDTGGCGCVGHSGGCDCVGDCGCVKDSGHYWHPN